MRKFILLLVLVLGTMAIQAQRSIEINPIQPLVSSVQDLCQPTYIDLLVINELNADSVSYTIFYERESITYIVPICFDAALDIFINTKWALYQAGYISRRQFGQAKKEYCALRKRRA